MKEAFFVEEEHRFWVGFSAFSGIGPRRFAILKNYFGSAKKAWRASKSALLAIGLGKKLADEFISFREKFNLDSYLLRLRENKVSCLFTDDKNYPNNLKKTGDPPFVLYIKGEIKSADNYAVAVVGTRKMTSYGRQVTEILGEEMAASGLTIVSGLARGVDSLAHRVALENGGRTIAVLGGGVDRIYPPENRGLAEQIINGHGAIVSEFPLGAEALPGNFPARNRIIAGLSLGTVVIECPEKSGAMITAACAAEQGREVFAVPGPIYSPNTAGPARLIRNGAILVTSVNDILETLPVKRVPAAPCPTAISSESAEEEMVMSILGGEPMHIDEIVRRSGMDAGKVFSIISVMEIKGIIKNAGGMVYREAAASSLR